MTEGIQPLDSENGFDDDVRLQRAFDKYVPGDVACWGVDFESAGIFIGRYSSELREWIKSELIVTPSIVISMDSDVVLVSDEQMRFSVFGAPSPIIKGFDTEFGVIEEQLSTLSMRIERGDVGFGVEDSMWAKDYLLRWGAESC